MLLAVAGLDKSALDERERRLASGDWSSFSPGDRAAFRFARKQSREPWSIDAADMDRLIDHFGPERTLDILFWACRCHYMTRVADAFQIPLERENVFKGMPSSGRKEKARAPSAKEGPSKVPSGPSQAPGAERTPSNSEKPVR